MNFVALLLVCIIPHSAVTQERCDVIEVNHQFDGEGRPQFTQAIFWDFDGVRFQVRDWRMMKDARWDRIDHGREDAFMLWQDGDRLREVRAGAFRETWDQWDPELAEREIIHQDKRRKLRQ